MCHTWRGGIADGDLYDQLASEYVEIYSSTVSLTLLLDLTVESLKQTKLRPARGYYYH